MGLRYHALHHLFPAMPYHSLDAAHHRLMAQLPPDSPYRQTNSPGLLYALRELIGQSWASSRQRPPSSDAPTGNDLLRSVCRDYRIKQTFSLNEKS